MTEQLFNVCKKKLSLTHHNPLTFVICEWQRKPQPNGIYLAYKILISIYFSATLIYATVDPDHFHCSSSYRVKWMVYLTYWTHIICALQATWSAAMLLMCVKAQQSGDLLNGQRKALKTYKFYWTLHTISMNSTLIVTVYYWLLVHDPHIPNDAMNYVQHIFNFVVMIIDFFIISHPVRLLHLIFPYLFAMFYGSVNAIYCLLGGTSKIGHHYIYKPLDWTKTPGKSSVVVFGTGFLAMAIHVVFWLLYSLRVHLRSILLKDKYFEQHQTVSLNEKFSHDIIECF